MKAIRTSSLRRRTMSGSEAPGRLASRAPDTTVGRAAAPDRYYLRASRRGQSRRRSLRYFSLVGVPVDQAGNDEDSADNQQQNGQDPDEASREFRRYRSM